MITLNVLQTIVKTKITQVNFGEDIRAAIALVVMEFKASVLHVLHLGVLGYICSILNT